MEKGINYVNVKIFDNAYNQVINNETYNEKY